MWQRPRCLPQTWVLWKVLRKTWEEVIPLSEVSQGRLTLDIVWSPPVRREAEVAVVEEAGAGPSQDHCAGPAVNQHLWQGGAEKEVLKRLQGGDLGEFEQHAVWGVWGRLMQAEVHHQLPAAAWRATA